MSADLKLLLVEDDADLGSVLKRFLEMNGFTVHLCRNGNDGYNSYKKGSYDLLILDVMVPGMDGFTLASKIRAEDKLVPFLFLTVKNDPKDKLKGLRLMADDYIVKPFDPDELVLRVKNIIRRYKNYSDEYQLGEYVFIPHKLLLVHPSKKFNLTSQETQLLQMLTQHRNKILKREDILETIWGKNDYFLGRSLDVFISRLRKQLNYDPSIKIRNIRGIGFMLSLEDA